MEVLYGKYCISYSKVCKLWNKKFFGITVQHVCWKPGCKLSGRKSLEMQLGGSATAATPVTIITLLTYCTIYEHDLNKLC